MIRLLREFRVIPVLLIAAGCLFALKIVGLLFDGGYLLGSRTLKNDGVITLSLAPTAQQLTSQTIPLDNSSPDKSSWMGQFFGYPEVTGSLNPANVPPKKDVTVTGSTAAPKPAPKDTPDQNAPSAAKTPPPPPPPPGVMIPLDNARTMSAAERAILERLHVRRQELDARARELDMRESLVKEAEKKLDARANELKEMEVKVNTGLQNKEQAESSRFKSLATMYENMKAKDAAKIFDRLDIKVLLDMTAQINPRRMSEILAQMNPEAAEKLTIELAARANGGEKTSNPANLPKIEGRPNGT